MIAFKYSMSPRNSNLSTEVKQASLWFPSWQATWLMHTFAVQSHSGLAVFRGTQIFTLRYGISCLLWNLLLAAENAELPIFLLPLYLIQGFTGFFCHLKNNKI